MSVTNDITNERLDAVKEDVAILSKELNGS